MKITVVTPLMRLKNLQVLEDNIRSVLAPFEWHWLIVLDKVTCFWDAENLVSNSTKITARTYEGGDRWRSSVARNYAIEITEGFILNLDDDCLLHEEMTEILRQLEDFPEVKVAAWQTIDVHGMIKNAPTPHIASPADTNAFGYQREILEQHAWLIEEDADVQFFNRLRVDGFDVAYFNKPGVRWNVNR